MKSFSEKPKPLPKVVVSGKVYCPMCTHVVEVDIERVGKHGRVKPGQKCPRCSASLGACSVLTERRAA
jgi:hypothetical protein